MAQVGAGAQHQPPLTELPGLDVPHVDLETRPARDAVDGAREDLADADRGDGVQHAAGLDGEWSAAASAGTVWLHRLVLPAQVALID